MSDALWLALAAALSLAGMAWLALAMDVHWRQVMRGSPSVNRGARLVLRGLGALALFLSLLACLKADRPSMAALVWVMLMAGSAVTVAMTLASWPALLSVLWPVGRRDSHS